MRPLSLMTVVSSTKVFTCECAVNAKIPFSLFPKLEMRIRKHLANHLNHNDTLVGVSFDEDEVLAATIDLVRISDDGVDGCMDGVGAGAGDACEAAIHTDTSHTSHTSHTPHTPRAIQLHMYKYPIAEDDSRTIDVSPTTGGEDGCFYRLDTFPDATFDGLWESLEFDVDVKAAVLGYIAAIFRFSTCGLTMDHQLSFHRMLLIHGPPGTGKSTLAKALVSKMATRLWSLQAVHHDTTTATTPLYEHIRCFTVNSNQLFSRWFSESGKMIQRLFDDIRLVARSVGVFVCVVIDEVESLAMNRKQSIQGSEPTDSIRAVNTLLTQIDQLRGQPNVLFLATSNFPQLVDEAFLDRVDWQLEVQLPSHVVVYNLLAGAVMRLMDALLIAPREELATAKAADLIGGPSARLFQLSRRLQGMSGRAVKKLPLVAYAQLLKKHAAASSFPLDDFLDALVSMQ